MSATVESAEWLPSGRGIHQRNNGTLHISARSEYGIIAMVELGSEFQRNASAWTATRSISERHGIPAKFLENIMCLLRAGELVESSRGSAGGFRLSSSPRDIELARIVRVLDGPLVDVRGLAPEEHDYPGCASHLRELWIATLAAVRSVLENVTIADVLNRTLPLPSRAGAQGPCGNASETFS